MFLEKIKTIRASKNTAQYQLTKRFLAIFFSVLLVMNMLYLIAAAGFVYEFIENKAQSALSTLKVENNKETDWEQLIDTFVSAKEDDALIIETTEGVQYYSKESSEVFNDLYKGKSFPLFNNVVFSDEGVYYVANKQFETFKAQLAISGETATELVSGMFAINLILNMIALVLGGFLIYWSIGKWSSKLRRMSDEIGELDISNPTPITIPEDPIEIQEVGTAFNQLLEEQKEMMARERQFITNASHDLKTPIAAIRGHVKLIKRRGESHPEVIGTSIEFIDKESKRLEKLSGQLLLLDREQGQLATERINLSEVIMDEIEKNQLLHEREFVTAIDSQIFVEGLKTDFQQLAQNLVENAVKYSPVNSRIDVSLKQEETGIVFKVTDQGIGISETEKQQVFERFYRADQSRTSQIEGSGIGLSIVKQMIGKYRGHIKIEDNEPEGTIFIVVLPR